MTDDYLRKTIAAYDTSPEKYVKSTQKLVSLLEIKKFAKHLPPNGLILDAGCAFGRDTKILTAKGFKVVGVDLPEELLKRAKKFLPQVKFLLMDVRRLKFHDNYFDGIWCHATLLHLNKDDIRKSLREFYRVLKTKGILFVSFKEGEGSEEKLETFSSDYPRFFNYQTRESLVKLLNETGFRLLEIYIVNEKERFGKDKRDLNWVYSFSTK